MIFILVLSIKSRLETADLSPPFYPNEKNRLGYWDVGGSAIIDEDVIILAPPIQYHKGATWSTLPIPYGEWSINFQFRISEGNGGGGFGIWLINQHAADGNLYGGPTKFHGVSIIGGVFYSEKGFSELHIKCLQSNGTDVFQLLKENETCDATIPIPNDVFDMTLNVFHDRIVVTYHFSGQPSMDVVRIPLRVDLSKAWLGVTAMCDDYTSRFDLNYAKFGASEYVQQRLRDSRNQQHMKDVSAHVQPDAVHYLRNPSFSIMRKETELCKEKKGRITTEEKKIDEFFGVIGEFGEVLAEVATYGQLNEFVKKTMVPYAQGWHRRTFKIMDSVEKTKRTLTEAFNQTKALLYIFNETCKEAITKTDRKIIRLSDLLYEEAMDDTRSNEQLMKIAKDADSPRWMIILKYASIFEAIAIIGVFLSTQLPNFKEKYPQ